MKWFRKIGLWTALGCLGASTTASAQQTNWRPAYEAEGPPSLGLAAPHGVTLGRPTPIAPETGGVTRAFLPIGTPEPTAIHRVSYNVARGARPGNDNDTDSTPPTTAREKPTILEFGDRKRSAVRSDAPVVLSPGTSMVVDERVVILDESALWGHAWYAGFDSPHRFYASAEWLMWTTRGFHLPPLVTTASPLDPEATRAALGFGTTRTLFGDGNTLNGLRPGARFTAGWNFDPCGLCAIEGSFFFLSRKNDGAFFDSNQTPVLGRPFYNINLGTQDRQLTTSPGILPGDVFASTGDLRVNTSTTLFGAEVNHRRLIWCGDCCQVTGLVGFRYLDLSDRLSISENIVSLRDIPGVPPNPPIARAGDRIFAFDRFDTANRFCGGQVGASAAWYRGPWSLESQFKLGLGVTQQSVDIDGRQQITSVDGRVSNFTGGLYALPSNIGHHAQTRFAVVPEIGLKVGRNLTDSLRVFVGYDLLYWSSVLRPGDQIDQALDANQIPNSGAPFPPAVQRRPVVPFHTSSFWAHGFNAGLELRY